MTPEEAKRTKITKAFAAALSPANVQIGFGPLTKAAGLDTKTAAQVESAQKAIDAAIKELLGVKLFGESSVVGGAVRDLQAAILAVKNPTSGKVASGELRKSIDVRSDFRQAVDLLRKIERAGPFASTLPISFAIGALKSFRP